MFVENAASRYDFLRNSENILECLDSISDNKKPLEKIQVELLDYCYIRISAQHALNEFTIRRHVFQNQYISDVVILWMVVLITVSGVVLASLQLYSSHSLAKASGLGAAVGDQSLEIERGRIALKSSVTGLFILIISLLFFYLYLIFVYEIEFPDLEDQVSPALSSEQTDQQYPLLDTSTLSEDNFFENPGVVRSFNPLDAAEAPSPEQ